MMQEQRRKQLVLSHISWKDVAAKHLPLSVLTATVVMSVLEKKSSRWALYTIPNSPARRIG